MAETKVKAITPFDVINSMMCDSSKFREYSDNMLSQNSFMINRRLAIKYPLQCQCFNNTKVNELDVMKYWADFFGGSYNRTPGWMFTPGKAKSQETHQKVKKMPSKQLLLDFCRFNHLELKSVQNALEFFYDETINEIKEYEKYMNQNIKTN